MMKLCRVIAAIAVLFYLFAISANSAPPLNEFHVLDAGEVGGLRITHFAPPALHPACALLEKHKFEEALALFQQELERNPDSLIAFVGFVHSSSPKYWSKEINKLNAKHVEQSGTLMEKFHLGMILSCFYTAKLQNSILSHKSQPKPTEDEYQKALHGKQLMYDAYQICDDPNQTLIMGYLAQNAYIRDHSEKFDLNNIEDKMMLRLGGEQISRSYQKAKKAHWMGDPPPIEGVPSSKLRSFRAVVLNLWCRTGERSGRMVNVNGKSVLKWDPISPQQLQMHPYMDKWKALVDKALEKLDKQ